MGEIAGQPENSPSESLRPWPWPAVSPAPDLAGWGGVCNPSLLTFPLLLRSF